MAKLRAKNLYTLVSATLRLPGRLINRKIQTTRHLRKFNIQRWQFYKNNIFFANRCRLTFYVVALQQSNRSGGVFVNWVNKRYILVIGSSSVGDRHFEFFSNSCDLNEDIRFKQAINWSLFSTDNPRRIKTRTINRRKSHYAFQFLSSQSLPPPFVPLAQRNLIYPADVKPPSNDTPKSRARKSDRITRSHNSTCIPGKGLNDNIIYAISRQKRHVAETINERRRWFFFNPVRVLSIVYTWCRNEWTIGTAFHSFQKRMPRRFGTSNRMRSIPFTCRTERRAILQAQHEEPFSLAYTFRLYHLEADCDSVNVIIYTFKVSGAGYVSHWSTRKSIFVYEGIRFFWRHFPTIFRSSRSKYQCP